MFGFLGFILVLVLVIILFAFAVLGNLVRFILGIGKRTPQSSSSTYRSSTQTNEQPYTSQESRTQSTHGKKKIFGEDEGEYVEFEEIN